MRQPRKDWRRCRPNRPVCARRPPGSGHRGSRLRSSPRQHAPAQRRSTATGTATRSERRLIGPDADGRRTREDVHKLATSESWRTCRMWLGVRGPASPTGAGGYNRVGCPTEDPP
jgi:hypothetical protein